jgi:hypothetical protein
MATQQISRGSLHGEIGGMSGPDHGASTLARDSWVVTHDVVRGGCPSFAGLSIAPLAPRFVPVTEFSVEGLRERLCSRRALSIAKGSWLDLY